MSETMLCLPQKSSISWVSGTPPMSEPARFLRGKMRLKTWAGCGVRRNPDQDQRAVELQEVEVGIDVVIGGDRVEDEVEAPGVFGHGVGVLGDDDLIGAQSLAVGDLALRGGEENRVRAKGVGELDAHVAQAAQADDTDSLSLGHVPLAERGVRGNAGAQERRCAGRVKRRRHLEGEGLVDDDVLGVSAVRRLTGVLVDPAVGEARGAAGAELFEAALAAGAGAAGVDQAPDGGQVADLELLHIATDRGDSPRGSHARGRRETW
jgi:hypothetical protein